MSSFTLALYLYDYELKVIVSDKDDQWMKSEKSSQHKNIQFKQER